YRPDQVTGRVREFMRRAGLRASLHSLRHFMASYLLSKGASVAAVSERLGHANPAITLGIYSHMMDTDDAATAKTIDTGLEKLICSSGKQLKTVLVTRGDTEA